MGNCLSSEDPKRSSGKQNAQGFDNVMTPKQSGSQNGQNFRETPLTSPSRVPEPENDPSKSRHCGIILSVFFSCSL